MEEHAVTKVVRFRETGGRDFVVHADEVESITGDPAEAGGPTHLRTRSGDSRPVDAGLDEVMTKLGWSEKEGGKAAAGF
jgi:hypothetical protein